jgi:hypothetical protein
MSVPATSMWNSDAWRRREATPNARDVMRHCHLIDNGVHHIYIHTNITRYVARTYV